MADLAKKVGVEHQEFVRDREIVNSGNVSKETAVHLSHLSEDEIILENKLRRKIDLLIMPLVILVYLMNYIDRNNYAAAKLQGLVEDLHLDGDQYQVGLSILFVGYVCLPVSARCFLGLTIDKGPHASSFECSPQSFGTTILVHWLLRHCLGSRFVLDFAGKGLR